MTQEEYRKVTGENPAHFREDLRNPVEQVSWFDAVKFCNLLSVKEGLPLFYDVGERAVQVRNWEARGYRLPTEAEWEYSCRAGRTSAFGFGDDLAKLGGYAWFAKNSGKRTHSVGVKRPNAWGLFDMHGNVWEWCWDWYDIHSYKKQAAIDPRGPESPRHFRVLRGGNWGGRCGQPAIGQSSLV